MRESAQTATSEPSRAINRTVSAALRSLNFSAKPAETCFPKLKKAGLGDTVSGQPLTKVRMMASRPFARIRRICNYFFMAFLILLGGLLFNLDRLDSVGIRLLQVQRFLPRSVRSFLPGGSAAEGKAQPREILEGKIIQVYDGDTATLLTPEGDTKYKIRFYGIDAPEAAQQGGGASRDALADMILGRNVRVEVANTDQYGRAVGKVYVDGKFVNFEMVKLGHAWHYVAYARDEPEFALAELAARRARLGLWNAQNPTPPWEYRKTHKYSRPRVGKAVFGVIV